jgi:hypothetical protein
MRVLFKSLDGFYLGIPVQDNDIRNLNNSFLLFTARDSSVLGAAKYQTR